jgi:transcriptional regulator with XRE-family HTH domain
MEMNKTFHREFGQAVRKLRRRLGLSQETLAARAGLHRTYLSDVERGARNLSLQSIKLISDSLGVSLTRLFSEVELVGKVLRDQEGVEHPEAMERNRLGSNYFVNKARAKASEHQMRLVKLYTKIEDLDAGVQSLAAKRNSR